MKNSRKKQTKKEFKIQKIIKRLRTSHGREMIKNSIARLI